MGINCAGLGKSSSGQLLVDRHRNESGGLLEAGEDGGSPQADCRRQGRRREAWSRQDRMWRAEERAARKGKRGGTSAGYGRTRAGIRGSRRKG